MDLQGHQHLSCRAGDGVLPMNKLAVYLLTCWDTLPNQPLQQRITSETVSLLLLVDYTCAGYIWIVSTQIYLQSMEARCYVHPKWKRVISADWHFQIVQSSLTDISIFSGIRFLISIHSTGRSRDVEAVVATKYLHAAPCRMYDIKIMILKS